MINRSKRRSIILSLTLVFFVWRDRYRSAIPRYVIERCPSPLPYPPVRWKSRHSKGNIGFRFLYRVVVDSLPGIQIEFSLSRSNDPLTNDFFPPALVYPQTFSSISICLIIIILESFFFFFFFFVNERSQHRRDHRGRNFTSILRKRVRRTGFEDNNR